MLNYINNCLWLTGPVSAEIVHSGSNESLTDGVTTNDDALLLPDHTPTISRKIEKGNGIYILYEL